jgi:hypothetical protein
MTLTSHISSGMMTALFRVNISMDLPKPPFFDYLVMLSFLRHVLWCFRVLQYYIRHFCVFFGWKSEFINCIFLQRTLHNIGNTLAWNNKSDEEGGRW